MLYPCPGEHRLNHRQLQKHKSAQKDHYRHDAECPSRIPHKVADGEEVVDEGLEHERCELGQIPAQIQASKNKQEKIKAKI